MTRQTPTPSRRPLVILALLVLALPVLLTDATAHTTFVYPENQRIAQAYPTGQMPIGHAGCDALASSWIEVPANARFVFNFGVYAYDGIGPLPRGRIETSNAAGGSVYSTWDAIDGPMALSAQNGGAVHILGATLGAPANQIQAEAVGGPSAGFWIRLTPTSVGSGSADGVFRTWGETGTEGKRAAVTQTCGGSTGTIAILYDVPPIVAGSPSPANGTYAATTIFDGSGTTSTDAHDFQNENIQSFAGDAARPYVTDLSASFIATQGCSARVSLSVGYNATSPVGSTWSTANELANITATWTTSGAVPDGAFVVNFTTGAIRPPLGVTITDYAYSAGGVTKTQSVVPYTAGNTAWFRIYGPGCPTTFRTAVKNPGYYPGGQIGYRLCPCPATANYVADSFDIARFGVTRAVAAPSAPNVTLSSNATAINVNWSATTGLVPTIGVTIWRNATVPDYGITPRAGINVPGGLWLSATANATLNDSQRWVASQIRSVGTPTPYSCAVSPLTNPYTLTAGRSYFIVYGLMMGATTTVTVTGSTTGKYWDDLVTSNWKPAPSTLSNIAPGSGAVSMAYPHDQLAYNVIRFTALATETISLTQTCPSGQGWLAGAGWNYTMGAGGRLYDVLSRQWQYAGCGGTELCYTAITLMDATAPTAPRERIAYFTRVANVTAGSGSWLDTNLTEGLAYTYAVLPYSASYVNGTLTTNATGKVELDGTLAPTLTAKGFRETAFLKWSAGGLTNATAYAVYRGTTNTSLSLLVTLPPTVRSYDDEMAPGNDFYYAVRVANATTSTGNSNVVHVAYTPPPPPLYGDNGIIYGPGGKAQLAATMKISPTALGIFYGLIYLLGFTAAGFALGASSGHGGFTATFGAIVGLVFTIVLDFFPAWLVALVAVVAGATFLLIRQVRNRSGGGY